MKNFLLTFDGDRQSILNLLDQQPVVLNWFAFMSHAILIVSQSDVTNLATIIHAGFPNMFFVITEVDTYKTQGWQNLSVWDFINSPKSSGRWKFPPKPESLPQGSSGAPGR